MKNNKIKPLFMWAGGKTKLLKHIDPHIPGEFQNYYEPFFGGGAVFIHIYKQYGNEIQYFLNDTNEAIMNIYSSIKNDCDNFLCHLDKYCKHYLNLSKDKRKEYYYEIREKHAWNYSEFEKTQEAATLYFLMKTGFNGIWQINKNTNNRFGTPAGLLNQKNKVYDKENILTWKEMLQHCNLTAVDFESISISPNSFVYLDPPYRGSFTQYGYNFDDKQQQRVYDFLNKNKKQSTILLSNRDLDDDFFSKQLGSNKIVNFDVTYTAGRRKQTSTGFQAKKAKEILIISQNK